MFPTKVVEFQMIYSLICLILSDVTKVKSRLHWFFKMAHYFWLQNLMAGIKNFLKHYNQVIFY